MQLLLSVEKITGEGGLRWSLSLFGGCGAGGRSVGGGATGGIKGGYTGYALWSWDSTKALQREREWERDQTVIISDLTIELNDFSLHLYVRCGLLNCHTPYDIQPKRTGQLVGMDIWTYSRTPIMANSGAAAPVVLELWSNPANSGHWQGIECLFFLARRAAIPSIVINVFGGYQCWLHAAFEIFLSRCIERNESLEHLSILYIS